jgi:hypothetical protein
MTTLMVVLVTDSRLSVMDPEMKFVGRESSGSTIHTERTYLSAMDPSEYCLGIGPEKYDTTGSPRYCSNVVVGDISGNWLVNRAGNIGLDERFLRSILPQGYKMSNTTAIRTSYDC